MREFPQQYQLLAQRSTIGTGFALSLMQALRAAGFTLNNLPRYFQ
jgi:hypothetical protein